MNFQQALMTLVNTFAGTITAIIAIAGVVKSIKPIGSALKRFFFAELYDANEKQDKRLDKLEMAQLKQIICDRRLPIKDRLDAGDEYLKRGGNGGVAMIYNVLQKTAKKNILKEQQQFEREQKRNRKGEA
jgi:hypothetical protein